MSFEKLKILIDLWIDLSKETFLGDSVSTNVFVTYVFMTWARTKDLHYCTKSTKTWQKREYELHIETESTNNMICECK